MPRVDEPVTEVVTADEYKAIQSYLTCEAAKAKGGEIDLFEVRRAQAVFGLLWDTGLRRSELADRRSTTSTSTRVT